MDREKKREPPYLGREPPYFGHESPKPEHELRIRLIILWLRSSFLPGFSHICSEPQSLDHVYTLLPDSGQAISLLHISVSNASVITMTVTFSHDGSKLLPVQGLPYSYEGHTLPGGDAWHGKASFGCITLQQVKTSQGYFRILHIGTNCPARIRCHHHCEENLLCIRTVLNHSVTEMIKGGGKQQYDEKQFSLVFGRQWQSLIDITQPGDYVFFDMIYKEGLIAGRARYHEEIKKGFTNTYDHIPERITGKRLFLTLQMHSILLEIRNYPYVHEDRTGELEEKTAKYLAQALGELDGYNWHKVRIKEKYWQACQLARSYIVDNLDERFTIPELSRKAGISATRLKQVFPLIFDYTIDDYHRYLMLKRIFNELGNKDVLIKSIVDRAGYNGASAFAAAFKKTFLCAPSEFNSDQWDIRNL